MTADERIEELEQRLNAAESAVALLVELLKTHKYRLPAALLSWYSGQRLPNGMPLP